MTCVGGGLGPPEAVGPPCTLRRRRGSGVPTHDSRTLGAGQCPGRGGSLLQRRQQKKKKRGFDPGKTRKEKGSRMGIGIESVNRYCAPNKRTQNGARVGSGKLLLRGSTMFSVRSLGPTDVSHDMVVTTQLPKRDVSLPKSTP